MTAVATFNYCSSQASYAEAVTGFCHGMDVPAPETYRTVLSRSGSRKIAEQASWSGSVGLLRDDREVEWSARLLAKFTSRELLTFERIEEVRTFEEPLVLVASLGYIGESYLGSLAEDGRRISVITGRSWDSIAASVAKALTRARFSSECAVMDPFSLIQDAPMLPTVSDVREFNESGAELLLASAHGRECLLHLEDGVICGLTRSTAIPIDVPDNIPIGPSSCLVGEGCYRLNYDPEGADVIRADEMNCGILFLNSCLASKAGTGQFPSTTTLSLSLLEGTPAAIVGSPALRAGAPYAGGLLRACLLRGMSLIEATGVVNRVVAADPRAFGGFVVLGDGSFVPFPTCNGERLQTDIARSGDYVCSGAGLSLHGLATDWITDGAVAVLQVEPNQFWVVPLTADAVSFRLERVEAKRIPSAQLLREGLSRHSRLWIHGFDLAATVEELRRSVLAVARLSDQRTVAAQRLVADAYATLLSADRDVANTLLQATTSSRFHFMDSYADGSTCARERLEGTCPECGGTASWTSWSHQAVDYRRRLLSCSLCGEVEDVDSDDAVTCLVLGDRRSRRGHRLTQTLLLRNGSNRTRRGYAAFSLLFQELYGSTSAVLQPFEVPRRDALEIDVSFDIPASRTQFEIADRHGLRAFVVSEGQIAAYSRYLWVSN